MGETYAKGVLGQTLDNNVQADQGDHMSIWKYVLVKM
jgi:hypothetical protein